MKMKWYDANVCHPSGSRKVLVARMDYDKPSLIQTVDYNEKFNAFNVAGSAENADTAIEIDYWADLPTLEEMIGE